MSKPEPVRVIVTRTEPEPEPVPVHVIATLVEPEPVPPRPSYRVERLPGGRVRFVEDA